ncbi:MAG: hypothetical protein LC122_00005, partial [Chitinophagales bacterium]|nr:hypothetical protein [Chitinophagales bacterium]
PVLYNYRHLNKNNSIYPNYKSFKTEAYFNYKNILKYFFITVGYIYSKNTNSPISNKEFINQLTISNTINGNTLRESNMFLINYDKYFPKIKSGITIRLLYEKAASENYSNKLKTKFYNDNYQIFFKTNTNLKSLSIETNTKFNFFKNYNVINNTNNFTVFEQVLSLKASLSTKAFITVKNTFNTVNQNNQKPVTFIFPDVYLTHSLDKLKTDIEFGAQNLFNQKTYTNIAFYGNTETINQIELRPFQIILKATVYFK